MQHKHAPVTIGLDIGIASVGWAVLGENCIEALGVRCFDAAEEGKTGEPLNLARRTARIARRRLARRVQRLKKLRRLLRDAGLVPAADEAQFVTPPQRIDPWTLRAEGLDRRLQSEEWARVLYHLVKHRGFYAARKTEEEDDGKTEGGKLTEGVRGTRAKLERHPEYRTLGEMVAKDEQFQESKRNKAGDYKNSFYRKLLREELRILFERQRELGNPYADEALQEKVDDLFWSQRPALSGEAMLRLMGKCTFEKNEYRAAKGTWSAERFVWLTRLNNLRISENGSRRMLTAAERDRLRDMPYQQASLSYEQVRKKLGLGDEAKFVAGLDYYRRPDKAEKEKLFEAKAFHALRKAYEKHGLHDLWLKRSCDKHKLDEIGTALSVYKTDEELKTRLGECGCSDDEITALLDVSFSQFINLSLRALSKILPFMESGLRYDEACEQAGYKHAEQPYGGMLRKLPPFDYEDIRNPVVYRALNQARKVVNALVDRYGSPRAIHVELARDLSRPFHERKNIEREQKTGRKEKINSVGNFSKPFPMSASRNPSICLSSGCTGNSTANARSVCSLSRWPGCSNRAMSRSNTCCPIPVRSTTV